MIHLQSVCYPAIRALRKVRRNHREVMNDLCKLHAQSCRFYDNYDRATIFSIEADHMEAEWLELIAKRFGIGDGTDLYEQERLVDSLEMWYEVRAKN